MRLHRNALPERPAGRDRWTPPRRLFRHEDAVLEANAVHPGDVGESLLRAPQ